DPFLPRPVTDSQSSPGCPAGPVRRIHFHQASFQQPIRRSRIMNRKLVATLAACASLALAAPAGAKDKLLIGSTSASSSQYGYFVALSQLINNKVPNVESSVVETGATVDNLRRIERGQIDFGLVTTNVTYHAYAGEAAFEGKKIDNQLLFVYSPAPQNV